MRWRGLGVLTVGLFVACSGDDGDVSPEQARIAGIWVGCDGEPCTAATEGAADGMLFTSDGRCSQIRLQMDGTGYCEYTREGTSCMHDGVQMTVYEQGPDYTWQWPIVLEDDVLQVGGGNQGYVRAPASRSVGICLWYGDECGQTAQCGYGPCEQGVCT